MAVKSSYKIPADIDSNYLDMEIAIKKNDIGIRPTPVRVVLTCLISLFLAFFLVFNGNSIIKEGGTGVVILFLICWILLTLLVIHRDGTNRMQIEFLPALFGYIPKSARKVVTRRSSNANPFFGIVGIEDIDDKTGMVTYSDGSYAYWYAVVGSASVLLFPEDKDAILTRVDNFYKNMASDCEIIYMTTREPQNVSRQLAHLIAQYKALNFQSADMNKLVEEQYTTLKEYVGKEFKSTHQYMIIKGDNREALSTINNLVIAEAEASSLMFRQCVPMYKEDLITPLSLIYKPMYQSK